MLALSELERRWLSGAAGRAKQLSMQLMVSAAEATGATEFVEVTFAHINSSHYAGRVYVDFAEFLLAEGGEPTVPTFTNASLIDCAHPEFRSSAEHPIEVEGALRLMEIYEQLGCRPMWSCAPYDQPEGRPEFGQHVIGSESNAVSFFNSVLGARTNKYGDFLDICGAIVGRVPHVGLHTDAGRRATHVFHVDVPDTTICDESFFHVLGIILGRWSGESIPVVTGIGDASETDLKAVAAAGATSGSVGLFHIAGVTPEAPTVEAALHGEDPRSETFVTSELVDAVRASLSTHHDDDLSAVCLGTPHFSVGEVESLVALLNGRRIHDGVTMLVTTSRAVFAEAQLRGLVQELNDAGAGIILDTCTYYPPRASGLDGPIMTNSAKWAYYAPGTLHLPVVFGSLASCVESAVEGRVVR